MSVEMISLYVLTRISVQGMLRRDGYLEPQERAKMNGDEHMSLDSLTRSLAQPREPKLVRTVEELASLQQLVEQGQSARVRRHLEKRARQAVQFWMRQFGVKRGPRPDPMKVLVYRYGALRRQKDPKKYSWSVLARMLDPGGYKRDPVRTRDRIRAAIEAILGRKPK